MGIRRALVCGFLAFGATAWAQLPDGPGKAETQKICGNCHSADLVSQYHLTTQGWTDMISKMIEQGAEGTDDQFNLIVTYLTKNFGPENAQVNVNKASASDLEKQLEVTSAEAAAIVKYRGDNGNFKQLEDFKKVPDLDYKKIEAKKDKIAF